MRRYGARRRGKPYLAGTVGHHNQQGQVDQSQKVGTKLAEDRKPSGQRRGGGWIETEDDRRDREA